MSERPYRAGYVAIIGRPNVGKSTLMNRLIGEKISITSRKAQTTRHRITGILTRPEAQLVFVDTPGYQTQHRTAMNRLMNRTVSQALHDVQAIVWVIEGTRYTPGDEAVRKLLPPGVPVVLAINKVDRVADKNQLLPFIAEMSGRHAFAAVVPVSAAKGTQVEDLIRATGDALPESEPLYGPDEMTTVSERFLAGEIVREKLFRQLGEELPYAAAVEIEQFEETPTLRRIGVRILVDKASQKAIVIGKDGEKLKTIGSDARRDMERLFGSKVFLQLWVTVRSGWADDEAALKRMGLGE
ncbi:MAG TPA: GTPase Era [Burkholderiales bacterium]|nr:GTPase Era [Burkholderiales bacterium]